MDLKPIIWISSVDHLEEFNEIIRKGTFKNKFFYSYPAPEGFPKTNRLPLTYFSNGEIQLTDNELSYQSNEKKRHFF